ncbi:MAG: hypothetical protein IT370_08080 [Deltaproteobacteria bacterium]|nr:hypothetical protein [Deltaproteobacteria bacterium]
MWLELMLLVLWGSLGRDPVQPVPHDERELVATFEAGTVVVRGRAHDHLRLSELGPGEWSLANRGSLVAAPIIEFHAWDQDFLFTNGCAQEPLLPGKECRLWLRRQLLEHAHGPQPRARRAWPGH